MPKRPDPIIDLPWSKLPRARKEKWKDKARQILFPDLRGIGGLTDTFSDMLQTLAKALYDCHVLQREMNVVNIAMESIIDDEDHTHFTITKGRG